MLSEVDVSVVLLMMQINAFIRKGWTAYNGSLKTFEYFTMPPRRRVRGHINLLFVRPDIDTWFVRLSPPTVLELQL
jgi:hypothetical protein